MNRGAFGGSSTSKLLLVAALLITSIAAITALVILSGILDPQPVGELSHTQELDELHSISRETVTPLLDEIESTDFTVRLRAFWSSGSQDIGFGLGIGSEEQLVVAAVSPLGYLSLFKVDPNHPSSDAGAENVFDIVPWQTWPHVKRNAEENEIWLDIEDSYLIEVRVNRELLWSGSEPLSGRDVFFWGESFDEPGVVRLESLEFFFFSG